MAQRGIEMDEGPKWTLRDVMRAVRSRRFRIRMMARVKWRLWLLPDVFIHHSPLHGPRLVIAGYSCKLASWHDMYANDLCVYCYGPADTHDHIEPLARGGKPYGWENRAPACVTCNQAKSARPLLLHLTGLPGIAERRNTRKLQRSRSRSATKIHRRVVAHMLKPDRCPPPLTHPLGVKLIAALEARRRADKLVGDGKMPDGSAGY